ncbi:MAG: hypothetical protein RL274_812 [Pseudomonadota bacterium]|jgi:uncharacterized membrane protein
MNRANFIAQLRAGLSGLHQSDVNDIIADYESHFADGVAAGRSEDEVAEALGDPARLARELRAEVGFKRWEQDRSAGNFLGVVLALIGLATIDVMFLLPVLGFMLVIFFIIAMACVGCVVGGAILLGNLIPGGWAVMMGNNTLQALTGVGLLSGGIGAGALLLLVLDWVARALIQYARLHFRLFKSANESI